MAGAVWGVEGVKEDSGTTTAATSGERATGDPKASPWAPLQGAVSLGLIELACSLCPPDHDPVFMQLPNGLKILIMVGLVSMILGGFILFIYATVRAFP